MSRINWKEYIIIDPDEEGIRPVLDLLKMVLLEVDIKQLTGIISVATPRGLRIRRR